MAELAPRHGGLPSGAGEHTDDDADRYTQPITVALGFAVGFALGFAVVVSVSERVIAHRLQRNPPRFVCTLTGGVPEST